MLQEQATGGTLVFVGIPNEFNKTTSNQLSIALGTGVKYKWMVMANIGTHYNQKFIPLDQHLLISPIPSSGNHHSKSLFQLLGMNIV